MHPLWRLEDRRSTHLSARQVNRLYYFQTVPRGTARGDGCLPSGRPVARLFLRSGRTAIQKEINTGDVTAFAGDEEGDRFGDLNRSSRSAQARRR